jgi:hypothetical protein
VQDHTLQDTLFFFSWNCSCTRRAFLFVWQGRFEILCLSGSYLVVDEGGGARTRSGGLCIALCGPDNRVIGGSVGGVLMAAGAVQVTSDLLYTFSIISMVSYCSFVVSSTT